MYRSKIVIRNYAENSTFNQEENRRTVSGGEKLVGMVYNGEQAIFYFFTWGKVE